MSVPPQIPSAYTGLGTLARGGRWRARGDAARRAMREARASLPLPLRAARASLPLPSKAIRAPSTLPTAFKSAPKLELTDNIITEAAALVERLTRYRFKDPDRLREALHISASGGLHSNRRLALVGDSVLRQILIDNWYPSGAKNGRASSILTEVASNASLAAVANRIGIRQFVKTDQTTVSGYTLATTIEAIVGAAYLDSGKDWTVAKEVMDGFGLAPARVDAIPDQVTSIKEEMNDDAVEFAAPSPTQRRPPVNVDVSVSSFEEPITAARAFVTKLTGYTIQDDELLFAALDTSGMHAAQSNRRLALYGDRVLSGVLADAWYVTNQPLVALARLEESVATNEHLLAFGERVGLGPHINRNNGEQGQPVTKKIMAATVEAIIGAVWIDSGKDFDVVRAAIKCMDLDNSAA
ncbi:hypothetical protein LTS10_011097 [Elasticomyces elasticus]|nr:hypothetical protein LTS10_011097 [Elasticomyces elasticus]